MPKQDGQAGNVALEHSSQGREEGPVESWAVHAREHVMVGAVRAMRVHVAPAQVGFWFNEEIESA